MPYGIGVQSAAALYLVSGSSHGGQIYSPEIWVRHIGVYQNVLYTTLYNCFLLVINYFLTGTGTLKSRAPILLVEIDLVLSGHYLKAPMIPQGRKFRVVVSIIHPTIFGQMFAVWFEHVLSIRPFISFKDSAYI